ncbi:MAG: mevalonate kinase [Nitrososphaerota archaeon]|jgi:mevalonate kinase|nr:mevalonate kinase [Nitrososphaerota archaeon]MDG6931653.1 mevalonate kinase [Nitrososphaerota archaeon]MDG6936905.1 mevalonate kinase [Nitrososphaerota archaeon]MDG6944373.1 mevalonate kinase [Nitrososphaerota archaeon]
MISASAPAKVIVLGEHFVVHGARALAASIDRYITVTASLSARDELFAYGRLVRAEHIFNSIDRMVRGRHVKLVVRSQIPNGAGLGSSAALSLASAIAVSKLFNIAPDPSLLFEVSMEAEKHVHGNPSGVDVAASLYGGFVLFKRGELVRVNAPPIRLLVVDSKQRRKTGNLVNRVKKFMDQEPELFNSLVVSADLMAKEGAAAISEGNLEQLASFMNVSQSFLELIGVSTPKIEAIIRGLKGKVLGAKITGAGGGGCIIAIPMPGIVPKTGYTVNAGVAGAYQLNYGNPISGHLNL